MIQILGLRPYTDRNGKVRLAEKFFAKEWRAESVHSLMKNIENHLSEIPNDEHWNLYYTAGSCKEVKGRIIESQNIMPIDIDHIDCAKAEDYVHIICKELGIKRAETGIIFSGHGLQFLIGLNEPITDVTFFDRNRHLYKAMCGKINQALYVHGMDGVADTSVFSAARLLRLPCTTNRKKGMPDIQAEIIQEEILNIDFRLEDKTGIPKVVEGEHIHPNAQKKMPPPDPVGVQTCDFIKHCKDKQADIGEPEWYAMLSIIGRLPEGEALCHEYSREHPEYDFDDTQFKFRQALDNSGPRTCDNVDTLWDGCKSCPHYNTVKSPIMLKSDNYIATKETGFYKVTIDKHGNKKIGKPCYDDLVKWFKELHSYTTMEMANIVYTHDGKRWDDVSRNKLHNFAEKNFDPSPSNQMCVEFESKLKRNRIRSQEWYQEDDFINFDNGVLEIENMFMHDHSPNYGFKYVLPFTYDPNAKCPMFDKFLKEVTLGREELSTVIMEFIGYTLAGVNPILGQKALILHGDGANGKSVLIELLQALAGTDNYSTLSMGYEINKVENRYQLSGKLFNVSEETPTTSMVESSVFKALVSGSELQARKLYCDSFSMRNYAKIIMACNELPRTSDLSHGMLRRLIIIPFDATFTRENRDIHIVEKLKKELAGIFNLAMDGYRRFTENSGFSESVVVDMAVSKYVEDNDSIQNFLADACILEAEAQVPTQKMYSSYRFYCDQAGLKPLDMIRYSARIRQVLLNTYQKDCTARISVDGKRVRGFTGIELLEGGRF